VNIYLVVEGPVGEKQVYAHWIPLVNPRLRIVNDLTAVQNDSVIIYSGGGYPSYFDVIEAGVRDVEANARFDRLVIAIDSEEMSREEKKAEIDDFIQTLGTHIHYRTVVQHFCLETWALGNKLIVSRNPKDSKIKEYRRYYDVLDMDPELLPDYPGETLNRCQFAERYLRRLLNDRYRNLTYRKSNPTVLLHDKYFQRVKERFTQTGHIASFDDFLSAFV
jgi:hypothetical protein